jgi:hypothetical protein
MEGANNSLGTVSLVTGVLSIVFLLMGCCGIPFVGFVGLAFALVAIITGYLAMQDESADRTMPSIGMGTGCLTLLLQVAIIGCAFTAFGAYMLAIFAAVLLGN